MTKSNFSVEKLQRKSVRTVWLMNQRGAINIHVRYGFLILKPSKGTIMKACKDGNLVTVKQILKAIR